jgi:L-malate glycosyltransferase
MRILTLIHELPPIGGGGGKIAQDICRELTNRGHEVHVLTAHFGDLAQQEVIEGIAVTRLRSGRRQPFRAGLGAMIRYMLAAIWEGLRIARTWHPDIIHVHFAVPAGPAAWVISRLTGIPYVLTAHLGDVPGGTPEKTGRWFRWVYPFTPFIWNSAAAVVAVSQYTRQLALKHYPVEIRVIPNGVDTRMLNPGEIRVGMPPQIVFAGRFMTQKNPLQVVRTLANLRDLPWHCVMLGDGPLFSEVENEIEKYALRQRFSLPGWVKIEEVIDWFSRSDILFMPSLSEGLPIVGVQALAMGLAIVASRVGGFIDLVEPGVNGCLFDREKEIDAESGLRSLLDDADLLQVQRQNSRRIAQRFDLQKVVDEYEEVLLNAAKKGRQR